jgi:hypothetical protein
VSGAATIELAWNRSPGAESCIESRELVDKVEAVVGRGAFVPAGRGSTVVVGTVGPAPAGGGWLAVVEARIGGVTATRRELGVDAPDCRQLDEAIVLVVALMADSAEAQPSVLRIPATPEPPSVGMGLDVAIALGMLPGAAVGLGLASEITIPPMWPVALWTHAWLPSLALQGDSGGRLGAWTLGAGICPVATTHRRWTFAGCLGASGGAIDSNGVDLDVPESKTLGFAEGEIRVGFRARIAGPFFAGIDLGAGIPFTRYAFHYTQADGTVRDVFHTAAVIPQAGARLEVRVP